MSELLAALDQYGIAATETQIRWAIKTGKVPRPPLDGSLRFCFGEHDLMAFQELFAPKRQQISSDDPAPPTAFSAKEVANKQ